MCRFKFIDWNIRLRIENETVHAERRRKLNDDRKVHRCDRRHGPEPSAPGPAWSRAAGGIHHFFQAAAHPHPAARRRPRHAVLASKLREQGVVFPPRLRPAWASSHQERILRPRPWSTTRRGADFRTETRRVNRLSPEESLGATSMKLPVFHQAVSHGGPWQFRSPRSPMPMWATPFPHEGRLSVGSDRTSIHC